MPHAHADRGATERALVGVHAQLNRGQRLEWLGGKPHGDRIPDRGPSTRPDNGHDPAPKPGTAALLNEHLALQPWLESIDQHAGRSQSGELDRGLGTQLEDRTKRQGFEVQTGRKYVVSEVTGLQLVASGAQNFEKL